MVFTVAESVVAQLPRCLARHHAHPRRHGDGGDNALQITPDAFTHETFEVRHIVRELIEHKLRRRAV